MTTPNVIETVRGLVSDASLLVQKEITLAKAEASEKIEQAQIGLIAIASGMVIGVVALLVLVQALVVALGNIMPPSLAALLVGVVLAVIAFLSMRKGQENLTAKNLTPRRTIRSVREDVETIKEAS